MTGVPRLIDVEHLGRDRVIGSWLVDGVLIDPGPESSIETLLAKLGDERPRALLLTHIHFDHAGASGALVERWVREAAGAAEKQIKEYRVRESRKRQLDGYYLGLVSLEGNVALLLTGEPIKEIVAQADRDEGRGDGYDKQPIR